jgi:ubiquitin carboxyl-terminal hydrolase 25/28
VKEDIFAQLLVNVSDDGLDLYDGLSHFLDDTVEFEGRQAEMEIDILELPPILQIQLQVSCPSIRIPRFVQRISTIAGTI